MNNPINNLNPKTSFIAGLVGGVLALGTIGFIILLAVIFRGGNLAALNPFFGKAQLSITSPSPKQAPTAPTPFSDDRSLQVRPINSQDHIRGDISAPVQVIEFSDLECPFCKRFHPTMRQLMAEYSGQVAWVYRHFPLDSLHSKARREAEATECAAELGGNDKFWAYVDRIFELTPSNNALELSLLPQIAEDVGLNRARFEECLNSGRYAERVEADYQDAIGSGGQGTPYSIVIAGEQKIPVSGAVPYQELKSIIEAVIR